MNKLLEKYPHLKNYHCKKVLQKFIDGDTESINIYCVSILEYKVIFKNGKIKELLKHNFMLKRSDNFNLWSKVNKNNVFSQLAEIYYNNNDFDIVEDYTSK